MGHGFCSSGVPQHQRHPEKQQEYVKETLYQAYLHSQRSLEQVLIYMAMPDVEDRYADRDEEWDV